MNERYEIIKKIYPDYLILIKSKGKIKFRGIDKIIVDMFNYNKLNNVNKLILDNLDITEIKEYSPNLYNEYYIKASFVVLLKRIKEEISNEKENKKYIN